MSIPLYDKVLTKTEIKGEEDCWPWLGGKDCIGRPSVCVPFQCRTVSKKKESVPAQNVIWEHHFGEIPEKHHIGTTCDNRKCMNPKHLLAISKIRDVAERFWEKVERRGADDCWWWKKSRKRKFDYGSFTPKTGICVHPHRMAWELTHGTIPQGIMVCHRCDNPGCCNPNHLFLGTAGDNAADMIQKGRNTPTIGSTNGSAKLEEDDVADIIRRLVAGEAGKVLAVEYGVAEGTISHICNGDTWRHVWLQLGLVKPRRRKSKYPNLYWHAKGNGWNVSIRVSNAKRYVGFFKDESQAAKELLSTLRSFYPEMLLLAKYQQLIADHAPTVPYPEDDTAPAIEL